MAIERMHMCNECIFLSSDIIGRWICTRPDGTGNYKAHPYVGACIKFKPKRRIVMKASEAPEKIYLQDSMSTDTIGDLWPEWFDAEVSDNSIEYTRTDAFIDKTEKYLQEHLIDYWSQCVTDESNFIEDFKTYMKVE